MFGSNFGQELDDCPNCAKSGAISVADSGEGEELTPSSPS